MEYSGCKKTENTIVHENKKPKDENHGGRVQILVYSPALNAGHPHFDTGFQCGLRAVTWKPIFRTNSNWRVNITECFFTA